MSTSTAVINLPEAITDPTGHPRFSAFGILVNTELVSYFNRLVAAGYTPTSTEVEAWDVWMTVAKSLGIWDSFLQFYPFWGHNLTSGSAYLKGALSATNLVPFVTANSFNFPQEEIVGGRVVGVLGVSGHNGNNVPSPVVWGKSFTTGFTLNALYTKASGYQNINSWNHGLTIVGDAGYTPEAGYPNDPAVWEVIAGARIVDAVNYECETSIAATGALGTALFSTGGGITPTGFQVGHRFQRYSINGATAYAGGGPLGGTYTQNSAARTVPASIPRASELAYRIMQSQRINVNGGPDITGSFAKRRQRLRMFAIDDGSITDPVKWAAFNAATGILFTALGKGF